jgi:LPXTG-motif cell wall-anchored protein
MASRRASLSLRLAILAAACGLGVTAAASGAAAATLAQPNDPAGANGTVKIDGVEVDDDPSNEPHVGCDFAVQFFGFDEGEDATIVFNIHPPSGQGDELLREEVDDIGDGEGGGNELDREVFFSFEELGLPGGFFEQPQQGFHVRLNLELEGGTEKHKVFWIKCERTPSPTPTPTKTVTPSPTKTTKPPTAAPTKTSPGALPVTGTGNWIGGIAGFGLALVAGGTALMVLRRRRDDLNMTG